VASGWAIWAIFLNISMRIKLIYKKYGLVLSEEITRAKVPKLFFKV